jgi:hypothetical protein
MEKIDRLGWAAGFVFTSYGVRIGVRTNRPEILPQLRDLLPPEVRFSGSPIVDRVYSLLIGGLGPRPNLRRFNLLYGDLERLARTMDQEEVLERFESNLQLYLAETARNRVFLHAGVVGWKGQAIVIPGRSFTGKTTLVAELMRAGAKYYSDEYAVLDIRGRVHPFPKPLGIRQDETARQVRYTVDALGGDAGIKPLPVGLVIISEYKNGARWRPRRLSPGRGVLALLTNAIPARRQPEATFSTLRQVIATAKVLKGVRGEAVETVASIIESIDG